LKITTLAVSNSAPLESLGTTSRRRAGSAEQPKRDQAVGLAATHGLRQIERAVLALTGQALEAAPD
jgi:hypothetical protein